MIAGVPKGAPVFLSKVLGKNLINLAIKILFTYTTLELI